jgi:hypothetical protein
VRPPRIAPNIGQAAGAPQSSSRIDLSQEPRNRLSNGSGRHRHHGPLDPAATSTDLARAFEALGLFVGDTVAGLDRNGVTASP